MHRLHTDAPFGEGPEHGQIHLSKGCLYRARIFGWRRSLTRAQGHPAPSAIPLATTVQACRHHAQADLPCFSVWVVMSLCRSRTPRTSNYPETASSQSQRQTQPTPVLRSTQPSHRSRPQLPIREPQASPSCPSNFHPSISNSTNFLWVPVAKRQLSGQPPLTVCCWLPPVHRAGSKMSLKRIRKHGSRPVWFQDLGKAFRLGCFSPSSPSLQWGTPWAPG